MKQEKRKEVKNGQRRKLEEKNETGKRKEGIKGQE